MDTIAAIATPSGSGGISVIRISGNNSFNIIKDIFLKKGANSFLPAEYNSHTVHFGNIIIGEEIIDEVLVSVFKKPNSYTGEDMIEISVHGGSFISQKIISGIVKRSARLAEPGEFTKRAFLNGKIDLLQAEAVADLINSQSEAAHKSSIEQLKGNYSLKFEKIRQEILDVNSLLVLELDFPEEDVSFVSKSRLNEMILNIISELKNILNTFINGRIIKDGVNVVIAGKPNSGKSSLFNKLLNSDRSIVSSHPGTTRDYIQESIIIKGIKYNLTDTAGLRDSEDLIENEGVARSYTRIENADIIVYLLDISRELRIIEEEINYFNNNLNKEKTILVFSKADKAADFNPGNKNLRISIFDEDSIERLTEHIGEKYSYLADILANHNFVLTNLRHKICLENTVISLENALKSISENLGNEYISVDLRASLDNLGEITGKVTNEAILNNIFSKFCIGK